MTIDVFFRLGQLRQALRTGTKERQMELLELLGEEVSQLDIKLMHAEKVSEK